MFFILIETIFVFIGIIADTVELVRRGFHLSRPINITPPSYVEDEDSEENTVFSESIFEHCN